MTADQIDGRVHYIVVEEGKKQPHTEFPLHQRVDDATALARKLAFKTPGHRYNVYKLVQTHTFCAKIEIEETIPRDECDTWDQLPEGAQ